MSPFGKVVWHISKWRFFFLQYRIRTLLETNGSDEMKKNAYIKIPINSTANDKQTVMELNESSNPV